MTHIVAVDTGGTFTDLAVYDSVQKRFRYAKSLTTYDDLTAGIMACIDGAEIDLSKVDAVKFGTTIVINTFVQRSGAKAALITTAGFRDLLELRRGNRTVPFDLRYAREPALIPRDRRYEVSERIAADGVVLQPLSQTELAALANVLRTQNIESVAVSFLNAFANSRHEEEAVNTLRKLLPGVYVTAGTDISREWYEYERTSTATANAYVGPMLEKFVDSLGRQLAERGFSKRLFVMASHGGVFSAERARKLPVMLLESGPAGGCIGAAAYARTLGLRKVIAFDMGGTTAKCAVIDEGAFEIRSPYYVGGPERGFPVRGGVVDIIEIGAGGGSIAWLDPQGRLCVGPRSAGSQPGPAAYGLGGTEPTITDANLVLGRIDAGGLLGGKMPLHLNLASDAVRLAVAAPLGFTGPGGIREAARGIIALGATLMAGAIKRITVERGFDPREFCLFVFGGGGPLHGATLARELNIPEVIVPPNPGIFSAIGMLMAEASIEESRSFLKPLLTGSIPDLQRAFADMETVAAKALIAEVAAKEVMLTCSAEMRYHGQKHSIRAPIEVLTESGIRNSFEATYQRRYGHVERGGAIEFVNLMVGAVALLDQPHPAHFRPTAQAKQNAALRFREVVFDEPDPVRARVFDRAALPAGFSAEGPLVVEEYGSTTLVSPKDRMTVGDLGEIRIRLAD
jgi:N-methylhydantoinase A